MNIEPTEIINLEVALNKVYLSQAKILYNIMQTNILIAESLGVQKQKIDDCQFFIDSENDLGFYSNEKGFTMNPKKDKSIYGGKK